MFRDQKQIEDEDENEDEDEDLLKLQNTCQK